MTSQEIRQTFLDFFNSKGHLIVPSAPIVLKNDPTLMFNNSGMAQFKDFFLDNATPPSLRIADTQKCLRVTGKHNDLEDVGHDTYHHTMFEMLGNWSFGDYFKKEAIAWSWELLTEVYKLPKDRLYATVFEGDANENLAQDTEALELWKQYLPESQILFGNKKDNFWEMGETGPCGPCSEIHIDLRSVEEIAKKSGRELVNHDDPQVIEIWNNVFMQFERMADKSLRLLPAKHVDTGMGFERLCMAIQGKTSNYDTDIFQPMIQFIAQKANVQYGTDQKTDIALRVVSDHIRAVAFAIADGQLPSNNKAGYVIRRILRRAVRYGYSYLGFREPFMCTLIPMLAAQFKEVFPELDAQKDFVQNVIREEENSFLKTLEEGITHFETIFSQQLHKEYFAFLERQNLNPKYVDEHNGLVRDIEVDCKGGKSYLSIKGLHQFDSDSNSTVLRNIVDSDKNVKAVNVRDLAISDILKKPLSKISPDEFGDINEIFKFENKMRGKDVFYLYDTKGFPTDLTQLLAKEVEWEINMDDFETEMQAQKDRARNAQAKETGDWVMVSDGDRVEFVGYDTLWVETNLLKYRQTKIQDKTLYQIVLEKTPFYAESGGQVGDSGELEFRKGENVEGLKIKISDTKKENDLIIHLTEDKSFLELDNLEGYHIHAKVDKEKRMLITSNHSATHLMHSALREVLGNHVAQKGQLVNEKALRFDFSHFAKISEEDLNKIEQIVNQKIREHIPLDERRNVPIKQAVDELNATALFGEKYGDFVRVITFDADFSRELCGGTHVLNTSDIGSFKIMAESSSSAGVRRIEAITSETAQEFMNTQLDLLEELKVLLKNPTDLKKAVENLLAEKTTLEKKLEVFENQQVQNLKNELLAKVESVNGINLIAEKVKLPSADALKQLAFDLKLKTENLLAVLAAEIDGKPQIAVMISDNLVKERGLHAGNIVKELAKEIKGGGGGQPFYATAGGQDLSGLDKVAAKARSFAV